ncbi:uncharacterized protein LOC115349688 isoform X2 [Aquila chrysaetos chrysaetos]|uniref:uncharacterized protein LOC115349688 isoform X2 n=1 Tax=Aquila chrysaetos chrysaetos TaxID=223781 RepID=UPI001B7D2E56|nr:uncharacterized protein LOC115349688 isoform X2 [Aquila chrysaetos chrysaetos]
MRSLLWRRSVSSWVMSVHPELSQVKHPHPRVGSEPSSRLLLCHPRKQLVFSQQVIFFLSGFQPVAHQCIPRLQLPAHRGSPAPSSAASDPKGRAPSTAPAPSPPASARIPLPDGAGAWPHRAGCWFPFECWKSSSEPVSAGDERPCGSRASRGGTHSPVGHRRARSLRCSLTCSRVQRSQTPSGRKISLSPSNWQWKLCWELPPCNAGVGLVTPPLGFSLSQPKTGRCLQLRRAAVCWRRLRSPATETSGWDVPLLLSPPQVAPSSRNASESKSKLGHSSLFLVWPKQAPGLLIKRYRSYKGFPDSPSLRPAIWLPCTASAPAPISSGR